MQRITQTAIASIADGTRDLDSISSVLQMNATDSELLASAVEAIALSDGGAEVLWQVVADTNAAHDTASYSGEVVRMLSTMQSGGASSVVTVAAATHGSIAGVLRAVQDVAAKSAKGACVR